MVRRPIEVLLAFAALIIILPVLLIAALGIKLSSAGPVLYHARRAGLNGRPFTMYKFRTMHTHAGGFTSSITAAADPRIFRFGSWLRKAKIDELPQLLNIIRGDMAVVGPRPEDPTIAARYYRPWQRETLAVRPGLASPGTIYYYTHREHTIPHSDPEQHYIEGVLPMKLALDLVYVRRSGWRYDLEIAWRALYAIASVLLGRQTFPPPPEMNEAIRLLHSLDPEAAAPGPLPAREANRQREAAF